MYNCGSYAAIAYFTLFNLLVRHAAAAAAAVILLVALVLAAGAAVLAGIACHSLVIAHLVHAVH
jgi:hypothetical protein